MRIHAVLCIALAGCGLFFGPGYSMHDGDYFSQPPYVAPEGDAYSLRWRYGSMGFFFVPSHIPITAQEEIAAIKRGKVFWLEERDRKIPLEIKQPGRQP